MIRLELDQEKDLVWNEEKNLLLKETRGISFEEVASEVQQGGILDILDHPNPSRYGGQEILVVNVRDYVYLVPFVETDREIFLKTVIPSHKATKRYLLR